MPIPSKKQWSQYPESSGTKNDLSIAPKVGAPGQLIFYENQIKWINYNDQNNGGEPPTREAGDIKSFSADSRRNLFNIFTTLNYSAYGEPRFVSATWHYDAPDTMQTIKTYLANYVRRLKRSLPPFHTIWKFEYQKRGEPHFHFMIFPLEKESNFFTDQIESDIKRHWLEMKKCKCKYCDVYAIDVKPINEYKHALIYIAKEIGKLQERYEDHDLGRIWGTSQNLRIKKYKTVECTFEDYDKLLKWILQNHKLEPKAETYIQGLRWWEWNSSLFFSYSDVLPYLINLETKPIFAKKKIGKVTLRKYHFGDSRFYDDKSNSTKNNNPK